MRARAPPLMLQFRMNFLIRDIDLPKDKSAVLSFIRGSQHYERAFEPDRRIDPEVADEYYPMLMNQVAAKNGRVFVADQDGTAIGWAVFVVEQNMLYVIEAERSYGYIAELFVNEDSRSLGVGRALIAACEDEARRRRLGQIMIGVLTQSKRTADIYARAGYAAYTSELRKYL